MKEWAKKSLVEGLKQLSLSAEPEVFLDYLHLLHKWNQAYNLTGIKDIESMVARHLLDSLAILPMLSGKRILDVGTGAGLPGLPLALALPDWEFVLLDSNGKKTRFLEEVQTRLKIKNTHIVQSRVENFRPEIKFDTIVTRAFSALSKMICSSEHLVSENGKWLAMKGRYPEEELQAIDTPYSYVVIPYTVPGLEEERCCVEIKLKKGT